MAQNRELQNKINSLSDARAFYDPESRSSSGATHVLDHTSTILSPSALPLCDCGLPRDTQNGVGVTGNVFWTTSCPRRTVLDHLHQFKEFGILLSGNETWYCRNSKEKREWNETRIVEYVSSFTSLPKRGWSVESYWWNLFSQWYDGLNENSFFRNGTLENFLTLNFKARKSTSALRFVQDQRILGSLCSGSNRSWDCTSTDEFMTSRSIVEHDFPDFDLLGAMIASALKKTSQHAETFHRE